MTRPDHLATVGDIPRLTVPSRIRDADLLRQRREVITAVATDLFARKGFHQTSVDEIADAAGMTIGGLYKYVPSKQDVLSLICEQQTLVVEAALVPWTDASIPPREALVAAIGAHVRIVAASYRVVLVAYRESHLLTGEARDTYRAAFERVQSHFFGLIERALAAETRADPTSDDEIRFIADNIVVVSHMWAVNHAIYSQYLTLDEYVDLHTMLTLRQLRLAVHADTDTDDSPKGRAQ